MKVFRGSCHCGQVTFEVRKPNGLDHLIDCNCSICRKKGLLHTPVEDAEMTILSGEDNLGLYQFGSRTAKYWFCKTCGVEPFHRPRGNPHRYSVNVRCLDDFEDILKEHGIWFIDARVHPMDIGSNEFVTRSCPYQEAEGPRPSFVADTSPAKL